MPAPGVSTEQLFAKNKQILELMAKTLKNINKGYETTCEKLSGWLVDDRAYYEQVQPLVRILYFVTSDCFMIP